MHYAQINYRPLSFPLSQVSGRNKGDKGKRNKNILHAYNTFKSVITIVTLPIFCEISNSQGRSQNNKKLKKCSDRF